jgi:nucleotidyltransferase
MAHERNIGHIVSVDSLSVYVRLDDDLKSLYKSGYEEIYPVARINSYIIIPVGAEKIVAMVNRVMTREETDLSKSSGTIFLTESNRYLSATMVGTIEGQKYIQGVYNYPILDNPVWYVTREDLNIIFDQKDVPQTVNFKEDFYLPIGTSPAFPDYQIKINPDKMFAKHIAILGNTGSGKSCTLTAILQKLFQYEYNGKKLRGGHIVIFDTNGEYKEAFNIGEENIINPFWINDDGLKIPYWFMNFDDMDYLFEPTAGTQSPILKRAIALAKSQKVAEEKKLIPQLYINNLKTLIDNLMAGSTKAKSAIIEDLEPTYNAFKDLRDNHLTDYDVNDICNELQRILTQKAPGKVHSMNNFPKGSYDVILVNNAVEIITEKLNEYQTSIIEQTSSENRNIDLPLYYDFKELISSCFDYAIRESAVSQDRMNEYLSTLRLRMQSFVDDIRLASPLMLNSPNNINNVLVKFLAFILGDYCKVYDTKEEDLIYGKYYKESKNNIGHSQITIIDMSLLPFQVLETITGLIGRIILEFLSRFDKDKRGSMPVVIALEEAQNYIPEENRKDRESISRKVFERIAREGRKYGLSLLVSSQRPSELSKTVLSQCNSFIVHRIQNPDDQIYIRKLVSAANSEILSQLPTLPQQHVIIMGDCVRTPVVAKMNTAKPTPNSNNPEFINNWINDHNVDYQKIVDKWLEI